MAGRLSRQQIAGVADRGLEGAVLAVTFILPFAKTGSIRSAALGVGLVCLVIRVALQDQRPVRTGGLGLPMALTLVWGGITLVTAVDPAYSLKGWRGMATYLAMFILAINAVTTAQQVRRVLLALVLGATVMAAGAIREVATGPSGGVQHMAGRLAGFTSDYNFFSTYLVTVLPFLAVWGLSEKDWRRWAGFALAGASLAFVYLTYTRAAWIAVLVQALALLCLARRRRWLVLGLTAVLVVGFASARAVWFRNTGDRLSIWQGGIAIVKDHPVMGIGPGRWVGMEVAGYWPLDPNTHRRMADHPHNMFLGTAVEMGLPGLALLVWLLAKASLTLWRTAQAVQDGKLRLFVLATLLMVVGFLVRNQFDHLYAHSPAQLFWLLVGLAMACAQVGQKGSGGSGPMAPVPGGRIHEGSGKASIGHQGRFNTRIAMLDRPRKEWSFRLTRSAAFCYFSPNFEAWVRSRADPWQSRSAVGRAVLLPEAKGRPDGPACSRFRSITLYVARILWVFHGVGRAGASRARSAKLGARDSAAVFPRPSLRLKAGTARRRARRGIVTGDREQQELGSDQTNDVAVKGTFPKLMCTLGTRPVFTSSFPQQGADLPIPNGSKPRGEHRLTSRMLSVLRIQETEDGYRIQLPRAKLKLEWGPLLSGRSIAIGVVASYFLIFLITVVEFQYAGPVATVDEQVQYYGTARNFLEYGFLSTNFLLDLSTSSDPAQHPFVYNHQPPGPNIFIAFLMKFFGERYRLVRLVFGLIFVAGIVYYMRFARLFLGRLNLNGEGYTLLFLQPWMVMHSLDHPAYSAFPFFAFFPMVALDVHYQTGRSRPLYIAMGAVFLSSLYLVYQDLLMLVVSWVLLYSFQLIRFDRKHLWAFLGVSFLGVLLHLLQSFLYLGPGVFFKEFLLMLSNRMFGIPTGGELIAFYRSINLVHHGLHNFDLLRLLQAVGSSFHEIQGRKSIVFLGLVAMATGAIRVGRFNRSENSFTVPNGDIILAIRYFAAMALWLVAVVVVPLLMFPAYSEDYGLQGMHEFFLAIGAVAVVGYVLREVVGYHPLPDFFRQLLGSHSRDGVTLEAGAPGGKWLWRTSLWVVLTVGLVLLVGRGIGAQRAKFREIVAASVTGDRESGVADTGRFFQGKVVMTNVDPVLVGFFTREVVFGGCESDAFPSRGAVDPAKCFAVYMKGYSRSTKMSPSYYLLFNSFQPGYSPCRDDCLRRLSDDMKKRYKTVFKNHVLTGFSLKNSGERAQPK